MKIKVLEACAEFLKVKMRTPTHLYITSQAFDLLANEMALFIDAKGLFVLGMRIVVGDLPENAKGEFFVSA